MAKICEHCKRSYDDHLESCPHCAAVEVVEDDAEAVLLEDVAEVPETPGEDEEIVVLEEAEAEPVPGDAEPRAEDSAIDLGTLDVPAASPVSGSDVVLAGSSSGVSGSGATASDVALVDSGSGLLPGAEPEEVAETTEDSAVDLAEPEATVPGAAEGAPAGSPSDVAWVSLVEADEGTEPAAPPEAAAEVPEGGEVTEIIEEEMPAAPAEEVAAADLGDVEFGAAQGESGPGASDLNLVPEAMEAGASRVYMGGSEEEPAEEPQPVDLHAAAEAEAEGADEHEAHPPEGTGEDTVLVEEPGEEGVPEFRDVFVEETIVSEEPVGEPAAAGEAATDLGEDMVNLEAEGQPAGDSAVDLGGPMVSGSGGGLGSAPSGPAAEQGAGLEETSAFEQDALRELQDEGAETSPADRAGLSEEETVESPAADEEAAATAGAGPAPKRRGGVVPWVGGWFIGTALTAAAAAALWFIGLVPERNPVKTPPRQPGQQQPVAEAPSMDKARSRIMEGDYTKALDTFGQLEQAEGTKPEFQAARGEAQWLAGLEQLAKENKPVTGQNLAQLDSVTKARQDLENAAKAGNAEAKFWLGQMQELTGDLKAAKDTYQEGLAAPGTTPAQKRRFQAALNRLELSPSAKPSGAGTRLMPKAGPEAYWLALAMLALQAPPAGAGQPPQPAGPGAGQPPQPGAPGAGDEADTEEAGYYFWDAVKLAQNNKYAQAIQELDKARQTHDTRRFTRLRKSQNPLSDPTEQIFLRACDELKAFWQVRDDLSKAGYLDVNKPTTPDDVVKAMDRIGNEKSGLAELAKKLGNAKDPLKAVDQLLDDKKKAEDDKAKAEKQVADVLAAAKAAGAKDDDPVKALQNVDAARKAADKKAADVLAALKDAGVNAADPVKGVADLDMAKKAAEKKVTDVQGALKDAGVNAADPVKGVADLDAARKAANGTLDGLLKKLVDRKYLPPTATRTDVAKGLDGVLGDVDHPVVVALAHVAADLGGMGGKCGNDLAQAIDVRRRLVTAEMDVGRLNAELADRWTPRQMLDVWVTVLRDPANRELAPRALQDVRRVSNEKAGPEAECVRGLAARCQGHFEEARRALKQAVKGGDASGPWQNAATAALASLTDPSSLYVPLAQTLQSEQQWDDARKVVDEAMQVFPKDQFPKEHAALLALRSGVVLDLARSRARGKPSAEQLADSQEDAAAAVAGGETVEGPYAQGRLAEVRGDLAKAEAAYRTALKAYAEASADGDKDGAAFRKTHPASDPAGSRYRVALSRVLLAQVEGGQGPPPAKEEKLPKAGGDKTTGRDAKAETAADVIVASPPVFFACWCGCMPPYGMPVVLLQQPPGAGDVAGEPPDPRLVEVAEMGDRLIAAGDYRGYLVKGEALGRMHRWGDGMKATVAGVARALPVEAAGHFTWVMEHHPCFQRRDGIRPPDPMLAEEHFAAGLRYYFDRRYADAEKELSDAVYYNDQDARYEYFLGLARLPQPGKRDLALEDFRQAARLEQQGRPPSAAVSIALERIQGPTRRLLNEVRTKAIQDATSRPDVPPRVP